MQMRTAKRVDLAGCGAFVPAVLKEPADFVRGKICVKFENRVAKDADNGYKKRRPDFSPDYCGGAPLPGGWHQGCAELIGINCLIGFDDEKVDWIFGSDSLAVLHCFVASGCGRIGDD